MTKSKHQKETSLAYVLHTRPYRDTSLLVYFLTQKYGRISTVARGARTTTKRKAIRLQPFQEYWISWYGKGDLFSLAQYETHAAPLLLEADYLISGLYLNELLTRLLTSSDPCLKLFETYADTLKQFNQQAPVEPCLRYFEKTLLSELGYGVQLTHEQTQQEAIQTKRYYHFQPESGLVLVQGNANNQTKYLGRDLLGLHADQFNDKDVLHCAKRLFRQALAPLLGYQPLRSRELFVK